MAIAVNQPAYQKITVQNFHRLVDTYPGWVNGLKSIDFYANRWAVLHHDFPENRWHKGITLIDLIENRIIIKKNLEYKDELVLTPEDVYVWQYDSGSIVIWQMNFLTGESFSGIANHAVDFPEAIRSEFTLSLEANQTKVHAITAHMAGYELFIQDDGWVGLRSAGSQVIENKIPSPVDSVVAGCILQDGLTLLTVSRTVDENAYNPNDRLPRFHILVWHVP